MRERAPQSQVKHYEEWTLTITPAEGEQPWPDLQAYERGPVFVPDTITAKLVRGADRPHVSASGGRRTSAGNISQGRSHRSWYSFEALPGWVAEAIEEARKQHGLGPGVTEVGW